jgi:gliding motility-associated protein GldC
MDTSTIQIVVEKDENSIPERITWSADDQGIVNREARAIALGLWDDLDGVPMGLQLWTKKMTVEEMHAFTAGTLMQLADTFERATSDKDHADAIRMFTKELAKRLRVPGAEG